MSRHETVAIEPGATLGMLGGGQLGRMFTFAAHRLGYRVIVLCPEAESPAGDVADLKITAEYEDPQAIETFARQVSVVTLEFENIPVETLYRAAAIVPVRPGANVLRVAQHRLIEKQTLSDAGYPVTPFAAVNSLAELLEHGEKLGWPVVLKTATWGYDGKGQKMIDGPHQAEEAWNRIGPATAIVEKKIDFDAEVSIIAARSPRGELAVYPLVENQHRNHILDLSVTPVRSELAVLEKDAIAIARGVAESLSVEGLFCIEFFVSKNRLMINEIAPRPHNSGHWTIEGAETSQFEQQVRSICNLPLGSTRHTRPSAMANLLGDVWSGGTPRWELALQVPASYLHLYGKSDPRPGRKMGHLTCLGSTPQEAAASASSIRTSLVRPVTP